MFTLQIIPASAGLAELGHVELHELSYGAMRRAMSEADEPGESAERLLAASLRVNGAAIGFDALQQLPGRFAGSIAEALEACLRLHGLSPAKADDEGPKA